MKKLLIYLKDFKRESILAPLFKMLEAIFELLVPIVMAAVIDQGIAAGDKSYIVRMCLCMVGLGIMGLVWSITAQYFAAKAACGFGTQLRHGLFAHIQRLSYSKLDEAGTSTLITRMTSDINQVQSGVNLVLRLFLRSPFIVFGAMIMAFTIDRKAAMVFVVTIPMLAVVVFGIMLVSIPLYRKVQGRLDGIVRLTRENLTGVRVIRAFGKEPQQREIFRKGNQALTDMQMFVGRISACMNPVTYVIVNLAVLVLIYTGGSRVDSGRITQGQVVALVNYMSQILIELIKLANLIISVTKACACGNRIVAVFDMPVEQKNKSKQALNQGQAVPEAQQPDAVEFKDVSLTYEYGGDAALSHIQFSAQRGQTIGIIGGTGAGKTSLINLIPGFYQATEGQVLVDGVDVGNWDAEQLKQKIGLVMQKALLFHGTLRDNLKWGKEDATDEQLMEALKMAQALDIFHSHTQGLDMMIEQEGRNLSGGQKQRLTIARALVRKPEILILDDSASALDYATDAALRKALRQMGKEMTVFVVSQRTASIHSADWILVLEDGALAGQGTHEQLLDQCSVYREIYQSQYGSQEESSNEK